jgi:hypothetical protein
MPGSQPNILVIWGDDILMIPLKGDVQPWLHEPRRRRRSRRLCDSNFRRSGRGRRRYCLAVLA